MPYKDKEKQKKAQHESYLRNKEKVRQRQKDSRDKNRQYIYEYKIEHCCEFCGETHPATLVFHHIDEKIEGIAVMVKNYSLQKIKEEIEKCDVLCANCHKKYHS